MPLFGPPNIDRLAEKRDVQALIKALDYRKAATVRSNAAKALGQIGDARAVEPLIAALKDEACIVRANVAEALGQIGDARAMEPLIAVLKDKEQIVRADATKALGQTGDARAVESLIAMLKDDWLVVRSNAVEALGQIGDARAVEPLMAAPRDMRVAATKALVQIGDPRAVEPLVRWDALEALVTIGAPAVEPLIAALEDGDKTARSRRCAAEALGQIGDARAVEPLIAALEDSGPNVRAAAAKALERIGDARAVEPLIVALKDKHGIVRCNAVEALGLIADARAVEALIAALRDEARDVRRKAAEALERFAWQPDSSEAGAAYWIEKREWNKCVELGAPAVGPLIAALGDRDSGVRESAVEALVKLGTPAVEPLRTAALAGTDWTLRRAAASALEQLGMPVPRAKPLTAAEEEQALSVLGRLCDAYATNDEAKIAKLEPLAREIGEQADWRGGLEEMRRLFEKLGGKRGSRTLEMHWGGIGNWRG